MCAAPRTRGLALPLFYFYPYDPSMTSFCYLSSCFVYCFGSLDALLRISYHVIVLCFFYLLIPWDALYVN